MIRVVALAIAASGCWGDRPVTPAPAIVLSEIIVDGGPRIMERGTIDTLTATALNADGDTVEVAVVWRSSDESVAIFRRGGVLIALKAGATLIQASSLGVQSPQVSYQVVWTGPAKVAAGPFAPANARSPGAALTDSVRVVVTNAANAPVANAAVRFTVTDGGGTISPVVDSTNQQGIAAARWTLGPLPGRNTVTASVIMPNGGVDTLVAQNVVTFTVNSYEALTVTSGDGQTGTIMSALPVQPSVKLVDSLGAPRAGVPVTFVAFANGSVTTPVVSTSAAGVASPGEWRLGDIPGQQILRAQVEDAMISLTATGTGTPIHYKPAFVSAGGFNTCALQNGGTVECWGSELQIGTGDTTNTSTPKPVQGSLVAVSVASSFTHNCALTSAGEIWCWGVNAGVDTAVTSSNALVPTRLPSTLTWAQVSPGTSHNCAITVLQDAYCWGSNQGNSSGQLGDGTTTNKSKPTAVTGGFKFSRVSSGEGHTCGLRTDGAVFCWGQNQAGQLGDGTVQLRTSPTAVAGNLVFETVGAGVGFTCALTPQPAGRPYCWGNVAGVTSTTPVTYPAAPSFTSLTVGGGHACGLASDGAAYCWGGNNFGQLGDSSQTSRAAPTRVAGDLRFTQISAGTVHTCAITVAGAVACWGSNSAGELGDSTLTSRNRPRHIVLGVTP